MLEFNRTHLIFARFSIFKDSLHLTIDFYGDNTLENPSVFVLQRSALLFVRSREIRTCSFVSTAVF